MVSFLFIALLSCKNKQNITNEENVVKANLFITSLDKTSLLKETDLLPNAYIFDVDDTINIDTTKTYQKIDGFGYTLTGGTAMLINSMSLPAKKKLLQELFGLTKNDIGISYLRLSIGASDLDKEPWSYNDLPLGETDPELKHFSLAHDTLDVIPVLKDILKISPKLKIMGSPWSPPPWMKDNNDSKGGSLKKRYYEAYANYFVKYIKEMKRNGIDIDAITIQNEPLHPGNNPSLFMPEKQQLVFIKNHLGPAFKEHHISTKIIIYDHNADRPDYPVTILDDPEASKYVDGSAFHLYGGTIDALSTVHEAHPNKNIYFTEQWIGAPGNFEKDLSWHLENIIIGATRNWSKTALEWNLAADENQEPHTNRGGCTSCLGALTITGDLVTRNTAYYVIAHASKFVRPGSVRIASNTFENIPNVVFKTPEGVVVVIIQNKYSEDKNIILKIGKQLTQVHLKAKSVVTVNLF